MITEGNGWEVIDEEQALELENSKDNDDSQTRLIVLGFKITTVI